jgi:hypothetical protein
VQVLAVVENCLKKLPRVFAPARLLDVDDETLIAAGKEADTDASNREKLTKDIVILSSAIKTLQGFQISTAQDEADMES